MKRLFYIPILALASFITPACNKKLDVQPQNSVTPDQIKTSADVIALLGGGYSDLQSYNTFGEQYTLIPDLLASDDQVDWYGTYGDYKRIYNKSGVISTNSIPATIWGGSYNTIGIANTVIDKISLVDSADRDAVQAEAQFMRGTSYFYLVGIFGKPYSDGNASVNLGVPLVLEPTYVYDTVKDKPSRATVAAVYAQILTDLKAAADALPESNGIRANKYAAKAMLARVYMSMLDYDNAAIQADDIIQSGAFALTSSFDKAFNNAANSTEDIFAIQQSNQSNAGTSNQGLSTFYCPRSGLPSGQTTGRGDVMTNSNYFNYFENSDTRSAFFTNGSGISGNEGDFSNKWQMFYKAIPVLRLAEMYLTRGEANLMAGSSIGADPVDDINTIRSRAGASSLGSVSIQDFIDERMRELAFEGDRFWTLKRNQLDVSGLGYDDNYLILPIPKAQIDVNANLTQNEGY